MLDPQQSLSDAMIAISSGTIDKKQLGMLLKDLSTVESSEQ